jgi:hypothetical protein
MNSKKISPKMPSISFRVVVTFPDSEEEAMIVRVREVVDIGGVDAS